MLRAQNPFVLHKISTNVSVNMADSTSTTFDSVRKLQGAQNYKEWKTTAVGCLLEKNCYDVVDGSYPKPEQQFDDNRLLKTNDSKKELREWNKMNNMAKGILIRIVSSPIGARTAEETWLYLEETYDIMGLNKTISTYQVLHQFRLKNQGDASTQCQKFKRLLQDAVDAGHEFNGKTRVSLFIHLTEEAGFANFAYLHKTAIRKDDQFPTLDELITEFIDDCASPRKNGASLFYNYHSHGNPNGNRDGNRDGNREKKKCDHCKRPGHVKNDCWKLHPEKQPKRDTKKDDRPPPAAPKSAGYRSLNLMSIHDDAPAFSLSHRHLCDEQNAWVYDTGATKHVCKDRELFIQLDESYSSAIGIGEGETTVTGVGTVSITLQGIDGPLKVTLSDVLYAPNCVANILSEGAAKARSGVFYHGKKEAMCDDDERPLARCHIFFGLPHLLAIKDTILTATPLQPQLHHLTLLCSPAHLISGTRDSAMFP